MNNLEKLKNGGCFIAGTVIFTDEGKEEIEDIQVGDYVYARDQYGDNQDYKEVTRVFIREKYILIHLVIDGETIITTEEHPFYIEGDGFVEASELEVGDLAETADGETVSIESVEVEYLEEPVTVYNFEVEDYHTYYVGDTEVLVHNLSPHLSKSIKDYLNGKKDNVSYLDCLWGELYGSINADFWSGVISEEQADYLRTKYL